MRLKKWEAKDILVLHAAGYSNRDIATLVDRDPSTVSLVIAKDLARKAKSDASEYMAMHKRATEVAAERGDAKPAMDMLDRLGAVPVTSQQRTALQRAQIAADAQRDVTRHLATRPAVGSGPSINIGIGLPAQLSVSHPNTPETVNNHALFVDVPQIGERVSVDMGSQVIEPVVVGTKAGQSLP